MKCRYKVWFRLTGCRSWFSNATFKDQFWNATETGIVLERHWNGRARIFYTNIRIGNTTWNTTWNARITRKGRKFQKYRLINPSSTFTASTRSSGQHLQQPFEAQSKGSSGDYRQDNFLLDRVAIIHRGTPGKGTNWATIKVLEFIIPETRVVFAAESFWLNLIQNHSYSQILYIIELGK